MTVSVELLPEGMHDSFEKMEAFTKRVADTLTNTLLVRPRVKLVQPGTIARSEGKTKHVEDLRRK